MQIQKDVYDELLKKPSKPQAECRGRLNESKTPLILKNRWKDDAEIAGLDVLCSTLMIDLCSHFGNPKMLPRIEY